MPRSTLHRAVRIEKGILPLGQQQCVGRHQQSNCITPMIGALFSFLAIVSVETVSADAVTAAGGPDDGAGAASLPYDAPYTAKHPAAGKQGSEFSMSN